MRYETQTIVGRPSRDYAEDKRLQQEFIAINDRIHDILKIKGFVD